MNEPRSPSRRQWLRKGVLTGLIGTSFAVFGGLLIDVWRAAGRFSTDRWTDIAPLASFTAEGNYPFPAHRAAILRRGDRLAALSLECTHLGCLVNVVDQGFFCPCHGSEFGPRGELYSGPATAPLPWHTLRIHNDRILIRSGTKHPEPSWIDI